MPKGGPRGQRSPRGVRKESEKWGLDEVGGVGGSEEMQKGGKGKEIKTAKVQIFTFRLSI